ncbi:DinB family protein [Algoriphagus aestuarii]|nr:DinB family protein [Algoriphagus aestuarii]
MNATLKTWKTGRNLLLNILEQYSLEDLNQVPPGFSNNIIWNMGHILAAQQGLIYKSSGHTGYISDEFYNSYKPGTKPKSFTSQEETDLIRSLLTELIPLTENDFEKGIFTSYKERQTTTGFHLATIQDALEFNNFHEGLHLGYIMSIRKFL